MRTFLADVLKRLAAWVGPRRKSAPAALVTGRSGAPGVLEQYRRGRDPSTSQLLGELKNTAWTCATINASVCASFPPRLYVTTPPGAAAPKCLTKALTPAQELQLRSAPHLAAYTAGARRVEEVTDHPLLTLLRQVNPVHNSFDLWELTQLYLEVHGVAYWLVEDGELGVPGSLWILPAQCVTPRRESGSANLVDWYEYRAGGAAARFRPDEVIHFHFPDPRDPYSGGLSPLRACYEQVALTSEYAALKRALYENTGLPGVVLSPDGPIGTDEARRLELQWERKFTGGGAGKVLVAESGLKVDLLSRSMGDLAALADIRATKEDIANAFHVPLPFLSGETNLANLQAAQQLHRSLAVGPRLRRRDEKLNEQLIPRYDPSGRLFVASEDPTPCDARERRRQCESDLRHGVRTVNEVRSERGLPPVPWGDAPLSAAR